MAIHLEAVTLRVADYPTDAHYPFNVPTLRETPRLEFTTPVTMFVGENGAGKSTLLEALVHRCGIHIWRAAARRRAQPNPYEDMLANYLDVHWTDGSVPGSFFGSELFRDFAVILEEWAVSDPGQLKHFGGASLMTQSHGQSLMSYFRARYRLRGLYFLDEPETALSPGTQIELLRVLAAMSAAGHAQFIIATHSPILLACPGATIYSFDTSPVSQVEYEDTEHFRVYRDFLTDRERYLKDL